MLMRCLMFSLALHAICGCNKSSDVSSKTEPSQENTITPSTLHADGLKLFNERKYDEAITVWSKELKMVPNDPAPANNIGMAYWYKHDYGTAIKYHQMAIGIDPNYGNAYYSLGIAYFEKHDYNPAEAAFNKSIAMNFKPADSYYYLVKIYGETEQCERALEYVKKTIESEPSYARYLHLDQAKCENLIKEQQSYRLFEVLRCDEETDDLCVEEGSYVPLGKTIAILNEKNNSICHAQTVERAEINSGGNGWTGTKLQVADCGKEDVGEIAVINEEVIDYKVLQMKQISDPKVVASLDGAVKNRGLLNNFIGKDYSQDIIKKAPLVYQYPYQDDEVYLIIYAPQPFILKYNDTYSSQSGDGTNCYDSTVISAFRLNQRYYARVRSCACQTDACGEEFLEIKKPQE